MSDNGPCNCEQALDLTDALRTIVEHIEEHVVEVHHYNLRVETEKARELLSQYDQATVDASRCPHQPTFDGACDECERDKALVYPEKP